MTFHEKWHYFCQLKAPRTQKKSPVLGYNQTKFVIHFNYKMKGELEFPMHLKKGRQSVLSNTAWPHRNVIQAGGMANC